jgi:hypothetical protein
MTFVEHISFDLCEMNNKLPDKVNGFIGFTWWDIIKSISKNFYFFG